MQTQCWTKKALCKYLEETVSLTAKEICNYVHNRFGVTFTSNGISNLLNRLEITYLKPKQVPGKAVPEAQETFLETYQEIKENKTSEDRIWLVDLVHPLYKSYTNKDSVQYKLRTFFSFSPKLFNLP
jgi:hypothetical protein